MCDIPTDKVYFRGWSAIEYFIKDQVIPKCKAAMQSSSEFTYDIGITHHVDDSVDGFEIEVEMRKGDDVRYVYMQFMQVGHVRERIYVLHDLVVFDKNGQEIVTDSDDDTAKVN